MYNFGAGVLIATPSGANPTPVNFGLLQNVSMDETSSLKPLFGQNRRPVALGAGTIRTTLKASIARISGLMLSSLFYGTSLTTGQVATIFGEAGTVPGVSTYIITTANSANWTADLGVVYAATGLPLTRVASVSAVGQYSVSAGVYTFYSGDASTAMLISYNYTISASGQKFTIGNPVLGTSTIFGVNLYGIDPTTNLAMSLQLNKCMAAKLGIATKLEDFNIPSFEFEAYVDASGNLGTWSFPDKM